MKRKKILDNHMSDKGLISRIFLKLPKVNNGITNNPEQNEQRTGRHISPTKVYK